ncbi:C4-type zinc ribbon domain-containing protein [Aneurinibacillus terranovensis]|uniref:C4-type zinc ribbon domain-containing protein n=1 Tax=Aneurinibacillus terranovensis TaxID=278991 RepID=UPI00041A28E7|nr:C4-type zinc ribbon domain-containing protein [Aneurinibacillus terranovensis]
MLESRKLLELHQANKQITKIENSLLSLKEEEDKLLAACRKYEEKVAKIGEPSDEDIDGKIELALAQQELWMARKEYERFMEQRFNTEMDLHQEKVVWKEKVEELVQSISPEAIALYEKIGEAIKDPVVEVKRRSCMGCFLPLSVAKMNEWRKGRDIVRCDECGRILV